MVISELIAALERIKTEHGDLDVETDNHGRRVPVNEVALAYRKVLKGRQTREEFWYPFLDKYYGESRRGEPVCRI